MFSKLILLGIAFNFSLSGQAKEISDSKALHDFENLILKSSQEIIASQAEPLTKLISLKKRADDFGDKWDSLIKSGKAHEKDLEDNNSAYTRVLQTYTHFILVSNLKTEGNGKAVKISQISCREKQLQLLIDYGDATDIDKVKLSPADQQIEALRKNLCEGP